MRAARSAGPQGAEEQPTSQVLEVPVRAGGSQQDRLRGGTYLDQVGRRLTARDGCATPCATAPQPPHFRKGATKRNLAQPPHTKAQPRRNHQEHQSAAAQPAAYRQPVRLRVQIGREGGQLSFQGKLRVRSGRCGDGKREQERWRSIRHSPVGTNCVILGPHPNEPVGCH